MVQQTASRRHRQRQQLSNDRHVTKRTASWSPCIVPLNFRDCIYMSVTMETRGITGRRNSAEFTSGAMLFTGVGLRHAVELA